MSYNEKRFLKVFGLIADNNGGLLNLNEIADKMNQLNNENEKLKKENNELKQDNDIKFWILQYMQQMNSTQIIMHELSMAIEEGYEVSDKFQKYFDELKENNKKRIEKKDYLVI